MLSSKTLIVRPVIQQNLKTLHLYRFLLIEAVTFVELVKYLTGLSIAKIAMYASVSLIITASGLEAVLVN